MILKTMEPDEGCKNEVVSPAPMLKLLQFKIASWPTVTLSCEPSCWAVALPTETVRPVGLAKVLEAPQIKTNLAASQINLCCEVLPFMAYQNCAPTLK